MAETETHIVSGDGVTLDLLIWRRYRRKTPGLVEAALDLNPGLADLGVFIPHGTRVVIPVARESAEPEMPIVTLWDY